MTTQRNERLPQTTTHDPQDTATATSPTPPTTEDRTTGPQRQPLLRRVARRLAPAGRTLGHIALSIAVRAVVRDLVDTVRDLIDTVWNSIGTLLG